MSTNRSVQHSWSVWSGRTLRVVVFGVIGAATCLVLSGCGQGAAVSSTRQSTSKGGQSSGPKAASESVNSRGNAPGNIVAGGTAAEQGDWIYYAGSSKGVHTRAIYKMRTDGTERTLLLEDIDAHYYGDINVVGDWVYFEDSFYSEDGKSQTLGIHKIRTDGTERTPLLEDPEARGYLHVSVVGDWVYFVSLPSDAESWGIYRMRTDGTKLSQLFVNPTDDGWGFAEMTVVDDWVYFTTFDGETTHVLRMRHDGSSREEILSSSSDSFYYMNVVDDWIYYSTTALYKIRTDGTQRTELYSDPSSDLVYVNVAGDWIYFWGGPERGEICRIHTDGTGLERLHDDSAGYVLDVVDDWVYYEVRDGLRRVRVGDSKSEQL